MCQSNRAIVNELVYSLSGVRLTSQGIVRVTIEKGNNNKTGEVNRHKEQRRRRNVNDKEQLIRLSRQSRMTLKQRNKVLKPEHWIWGALSAVDSFCSEVDVDAQEPIIRPLAGNSEVSLEASRIDMRGRDHRNFGRDHVSSNVSQ